MQSKNGTLPDICQRNSVFQEEKIIKSISYPFFMEKKENQQIQKARSLPVIIRERKIMPIMQSEKNEKNIEMILKISQRNYQNNEKEGTMKYPIPILEHHTIKTNNPRSNPKTGLNHSFLCSLLNFCNHKL